MYSTLATGGSSHKIVTKKQSRILYSYYHNPMTLFIFCAGNELFFVSLYLSHYYRTPSQFISRLLDSLEPYLIFDLFVKSARGMTWPIIIAFLTFPICFGKQLINCVQFWKASQAVVDKDRRDRFEMIAKRSEKVN